MMRPGSKKQALDMQRRLDIDDIGLYNAIKQVKEGCSVCHAILRMGMSMGKPNGCPFLTSPWRVWPWISSPCQWYISEKNPAFWKLHTKWRLNQFYHIFE